TGTGHVNDDDALRARRLRRGGALRRSGERRRRFGPVAERQIRDGECVRRLDVAADDEDGVVGTVELLVERDDVVALDALDGFGRARDGMAVWAAAEDDARRDPAGERAGAVHADAQRVEVLLAQAIYLFVLEDGVAY